MSPLTTLRLALAGSRSDTVRIVLTAVGATLPTVALLAAAAVLAVRTPDGLRMVDGQASLDDGSLETSYQLPYTNELLNEAGLRPGVAFGLLLLTVPMLAFVAQCGRLGAPARERRLAAIRMAGGTPSQVIWVAALETGLASVLGVVVGFGVFLLGRVLLDAPDAGGQRPLPTDVLPGALAMVVIAVAVPLFVTLLAVLTLRRVVLTPLGVVRGPARGRPSVAPGVLLLGGCGAWLLVEPVNQYFLRNPRGDDLPVQLAGGLVGLGLVLVSIGVVTGTSWITYAAGWLLHRYARRPAGLLAGRRMLADPWAGSRTFAAMLAALIIGASAAGLAAVTVAGVRADDLTNRAYAETLGEPYLHDGSGFYARAYQLVGYAVLVGVLIAAAGLLVALADSVVARRRTLASLVAVGTPRSVLARALGWQVLTPVVPAVTLAVSVGILLPRAVFPEVGPSGTMTMSRCVPAAGDEASACADPAYRSAHEVLQTLPQVTVPVEVPWQQLALLGGGAVVATGLVTLVGLLFLRMSTRATELRTA